MAERPTLTTTAGAPVPDNQNSITAGPRGPLLMQDYQLIEKLARRHIQARSGESANMLISRTSMLRLAPSLWRCRPAASLADRRSGRNGLHLEPRRA